MIATFQPSRLTTWLGTHGYCKPAGVNPFNNELLDTCVGWEVLYLQCLWWSVGMLMGAPISMSPDKGPYDRYYFEPENAITLRTQEQIIVIILKFIVAFHWTTVIARFVFVFNNLDTETKEFQLGW